LFTLLMNNQGKQNAVSGLSDTSDQALAPEFGDPLMSAAAISVVPARLLVIDRTKDLAEIACARPDAFEVTHAAGGHAGVAALQAGGCDVILADLSSLADLAGEPERAVSRLARLGGTALLLVVSTTDSVSAAVEALQAGAHDCLARPLTAADLLARIAVLRRRHDRRGVLPPMTRTPVSSPGRLVARSPQMQAVLEQLTRIAASPAPVFVSGEGGTGKRLAAETLHALGPLADHPFIAVNCAVAAPMVDVASSDTSLVRLAGFEGAQSLIEAGGGTLYLHEVGALGAMAQARLLQLVEPGVPGPVSAMDLRPPSLRIICSTRKSPADLVRQQTLRQDLFYRLNVLPIHLPPLRQRPLDIVPLAEHFLRGFSRSAGRPMTGFSAGALAYLDTHEWPGNVRQLENLMRRIVQMFDAVLVTPQMLAAADIEGQADMHRTGTGLFSSDEEILPMWQQEQRIIEAAIARFNGNIARAAAALEISPSTIYRKKQAWEERQTDIAGAA
jgi:two-component system repressor protein LuxO